MSLRRPDIRDDVLVRDLACEEAIDTGRLWALDEPATRASCEINVFGPAIDALRKVTAGVIPVSLFGLHMMHVLVVTHLFMLVEIDNSFIHFHARRGLHLGLVAFP